MLAVHVRDRIKGVQTDSVLLCLFDWRNDVIHTSAADSVEFAVRVLLERDEQIDGRWDYSSTTTVPTIPAASWGIQTYSCSPGVSKVRT